MSKNLLSAGFAVKGHDINPATEQFCKEAGMTYSGSLAETVKDVEFIVTALPATAHLKKFSRAMEEFLCLLMKEQSFAMFQLLNHLLQQNSMRTQRSTI